MKHIFKLSVSLFLNQILAVTAGIMCVLFVLFLAGNGIGAHLLFLAMTFSFFAYIEYRAAFKYGFHDADRRNKPNSHAYLYKGAIAGLISSIPLIILLVLFFCFYATYQLRPMNVAALYTRIWSMYYCWPMCNIFPNHAIEVYCTSILPLVVFPYLGYIAGYKNFLISDIIYKFLRIKPQA